MRPISVLMFLLMFGAPGILAAQDQTPAPAQAEYQQSEQTKKNLESIGKQVDLIAKTYSIELKETVLADKIGELKTKINELGADKIPKTKTAAATETGK